MVLLNAGTKAPNKRIFELAHDKIYNKTYATSEDSYQPAHLCSLIRVLAGRLCLLQPSGYPKRDKQELSYWVNVQAYPYLCWSHRSYCRFCHELAHFYLVVCMSVHHSLFTLPHGVIGRLCSVIVTSSNTILTCPVCDIYN